jgi:NAD(P)-dependent dehydrogenase (short-subunit alcohol dehydrogenase family)
VISKNRFRDRRAVITGGASGIGYGVAKRITAEGGSVCLWDISEDALRQAITWIGGDSMALRVNVAVWQDVEHAAKETANRLGGIDTLVASAGITGPNASLWEYPIDEWRRVIDVNLNGLFYSNRAIVPYMLEAGHGRIVNIASIAGKEGNQNAAAYSSSKAGVIGLTKSLGKELAKSNITVNSVTPAAVRTPIFDQMTQRHIDFMLSKIPMGRFGEIHEIVSVICWLASEECSFTTGAVFDCSGGRATY